MLSNLNRWFPFTGSHKRSRSDFRTLSEPTPANETERSNEDKLAADKHKAGEMNRVDKQRGHSDIKASMKAPYKNGDRVPGHRSLRNLISLSFHRDQFVVNEDISNGRELHKVPALSYRRSDFAPADYHYIVDQIPAEPLDVDTSIATLQHCSCTDDCSSGQCSCAAEQRSGRYYNSRGRLSRNYDLNEPTPIYECNALCKCNRKACKNMVIQGGPKGKFLLFKTSHRGWGVRTQEDLRRGTFIGIYSGELISAHDSTYRSDDTYLFNLSGSSIIRAKPRDPKSDGNNSDNNKREREKADQFVCDAKCYGNFTRFINHSCDPNVVGIRSMTTHHDTRFPCIAFFTNQHVAAGTELTLNYGDNYWLVKGKRDGVYCLCGRDNCRFSKQNFAKALQAYNASKNQS